MIGTKLSPAEYRQIWLLIDKALASGVWTDWQEVKLYAREFWFNSDLREFDRLLREFDRLLRGCQSNDNSLVCWYLVDLDDFIRRRSNLHEVYAC